MRCALQAIGRLIADNAQGRGKFRRSLAIERADLGGAQCAPVDSDVIDFSLHQVVLLGAFD